MLKPERKALLDSLVEEGVTVTDIQKKHGFNYDTIRKYFPDYRAGWTHTDEVQEKLKAHEDLVNEMAEERAPGIVIAAMIGMSEKALKKHRPDLMWTKQEAAEFAAMVSRLSRVKGF